MRLDKQLETAQLMKLGVKPIPLWERFDWQELAVLATLALVISGILTAAFLQGPSPSPPCELRIEGQKTVRGHAHGSMCHAH